MSNVIQFRKFTREMLVQDQSMELLRVHGTESGVRLYDFILDSYDDGMGEDAETPMEFIKICAEVFNDMEQDRAEK